MKDGVLVSANTLVYGDFPVLENGSNPVNLVDGVTKIKPTDFFAHRDQT